MCRKAHLSASYISKAKKGVLHEIPEEKLTALATVLELSPEKIFAALDLPQPLWLRTAAKTSLFADEEPIRLRFPYIATVPDHLWPLLAREVFRNFNIELLEEPMSLTEFKSRMADVEKDKSDTLIVVLDQWLTEPEFKGKFHHVAVSHLYHGYALVGRNEWNIRGLDASPTSPAGGPTLANLFALLAELRYHDVLGEKDGGKGSIAYYDSAGLEFVKLLVEVAQADPKNKRMLESLTLNKELPPVSSSSLTFLEPLSGVGRSRFDFVVGHALTVATALALPGYRVFANYRHLQQVVEQLEIDEASKNERKAAVAKLQKPVVVAANIPSKWQDDADVERKCLRICGVVNRASEALFKTLSTGTVRELEARLGSRIQTHVDAKDLRDAWEASYDFLTADEGIHHMNRNKEILPAAAIMKRLMDCKAAAAKALRRQQEHVAQQHFDQGNYFDACEALGVEIETTTAPVK